LVSLGIIFRL
jgi:hypothetical protein